MKELTSFSLSKKINSNIFIGREKELKQISSEYLNFLRCKSSIISVVGDAGIGKSYLIEYAIEKSISCYYAYGKNRQDNNQTLIAISQIIEQITHFVLTLPGNSINKLIDELKKEVGRDISLVSQINPCINNIISVNDALKTRDFSKVKYRVKNAVFKFVSISAKYLIPLVVHIDDLQWADKLSAEIIKTFIRKKENSNMMLILSFRDKGALEHVKPLQDMLKEKTLYIPLERLSNEKAEEYINELFGSRLKNQKKLHKLIDVLALGNPFYIKEIINIFIQDKLIQNINGTWELSADLITDLLEINDAQNLLSNKIKNEYKENSNILELIACLEDIDVNLIMQASGEGKAKVEDYIQRLVDSSIIIKQENKEKRAAILYSHDIMSKLIYGNIKKDKRQKIHYLIADTLMNKSFDESCENSEVIVSHLMRSNIQLASTDADKWVKLLYETGKKKKSVASIEGALEIFRFCEKLLDYCNELDDEFEVLLKLETAECLCMSEDFEKSQKIIDDLLLENRDKNTLLLIKIKQLYFYHYQRKHAMVIKMGRALLNELGFKMRKINMPLNLLKLQTLYRPNKIKKLDKMPKVTDEKTLAILDILTLMTICATLSEDEMSAMICLEAAVYCAEHAGASNSLVGYLASAYIMLTVWKDVKKACLLENAVLNMLEKRSENSNKAFAYFIFGTFFSYWSKSMEASEDYLDRAVKWGESAGDFTFLGYSILSSLDNKAYMGTDVDEVLEYINRCKVDFADIEQYTTAYNLQVHKVHADALKGRLINFDEECVSRKYSNITDFEKFTERGLTLQRLFVFNKMDRAYKLTEKLGEDTKSIEGLICRAEILLYTCLVRINYNQFLDKAAGKKNIKIILSAIKEMKKWAELNPKDFESAYMILMAEYLAVVEKSDSAGRYYNDAISKSMGNNIKMQALANLLAGRNCTNKNIASYYAEESIKLHKEYGANAYAAVIAEEFNLSGRGQRNDEYLFFDDYLPIIELGAKTENMSEEQSAEFFVKAIVEKGYACYCGYIKQMSERLCILCEKSKSGSVWTYADGKGILSADNIPKKIIRYVFRTGKEIYYTPENNEKVFQNDVYIRNNSAAYFLCVPVKCHQEIIGIIILKSDDEIKEKLIMHVNNFSSVLASKTDVIKDVNIKNILSGKNENTILSKRETMVIKSMSLGYTNAEISKELGIAVGTVKNHISNILSKLETDSRIKAVRIARERKIIQ